MTLKALARIAEHSGDYISKQILVIQERRANNTMAMKKAKKEGNADLVARYAARIKKNTQEIENLESRRKDRKLRTLRDK